ncbi:hypothetical protein [Brevibacterium litoralis]|uniref:hypothetical protein n=1 Tax=Brevibacterium litoralis TaxID=3138935 RepID=UPI0032EF5B6A
MAATAAAGGGVGRWLYVGGIGLTLLLWILVSLVDAIALSVPTGLDATLFQITSASYEVAQLLGWTLALVGAAVTRRGSAPSRVAGACIVGVGVLLTVMWMFVMRDEGAFVHDWNFRLRVLLMNTSVLVPLFVGWQVANRRPWWMSLVAGFTGLLVTGLLLGCSKMVGLVSGPLWSMDHGLATTAYYLLHFTGYSILEALVVTAAVIGLHFLARVPDRR